MHDVIIGRVLYKKYEQAFISKQQDPHSSEHSAYIGSRCNMQLFSSNYIANHS